MIHHVVTFQLAAEDESTRRRHADEIAARLESLIDTVPGIVSIEVHFDLGLVASHWPVVLVSQFESVESLERYQMHPRHHEVIAWMNHGIVSDRTVVDYET